MKEVVKDFLASNLDEAEYFGYSREGLITLKAYLDEMRLNDMDFETLIEVPYRSIEEKCDWLESIKYGELVNNKGEYINNAIYLNGSDGLNVIATYNLMEDMFEEFITKLPKEYYYNEDIRTIIERQKQIYSIQEELADIENVGRYIYKEIAPIRKSVSDYFDIDYSAQYGLSVSSDSNLVAAYTNCDRLDKDLNEESKQKVLKKIMLDPTKR